MNRQIPLTLRASRHDFQSGRDGYPEATSYRRQMTGAGGDYRYGRGIDYRDYGANPGAPVSRRMPRGYVRPDERIRDDLCERLYHAQGVDVGEVSVEVSHGDVTLAGEVPDRAMRYRIEDICALCSGVGDIDNRIRVRRAGPAAQTASRGQGVTADR